MLKWLLNHDQTLRPTTEELLSSDLLPPAQLEDSELQEMLRHALANPQSKSYKSLVARCLHQQGDAVLELSYHLGFVQTNRKLEYVKVECSLEALRRVLYFQCPVPTRPDLDDQHRTRYPNHCDISVGHLVLVFLVKLLKFNFALDFS